MFNGKSLVNYGKSPCLMGKSTISMAIFNSKLLIYQRVSHPSLDLNPEIFWWLLWILLGDQTHFLVFETAETMISMCVSPHIDLGFNASEVLFKRVVLHLPKALGEFDHSVCRILVLYAFVGFPSRKALFGENITSSPRNFTNLTLLPLRRPTGSRKILG